MNEAKPLHSANAFVGRRPAKCEGEVVYMRIVGTPSVRQRNEVREIGLRLSPLSLKKINFMQHKEWLKKFNRTKHGKIFNLLYDIKNYEANLKSYNKQTFLCAALSIATKGTKMEKDAKELIGIICPSYYSEEA